mmetsp:Transcript_9890/g.11526  ORF Transcript_9890/g.11526 Transcript_9890/m.11526 type:complete len:469 (-) Transcript_9890:126-1532(-)
MKLQFISSLLLASTSSQCKFTLAFTPSSPSLVTSYTRTIRQHTQENILSKQAHHHYGAAALHAILPSDFVDIHTASQILDSSSALLADAAAATADVAADVVDAAAKADDGWWAKYLLIYKGLLEGVHSVVDQPLRNAGWDQTWGISIFLFTAGVRTLLLPLSIQQTKSSEYIKSLKPYQDEIKRKFKDNKDMQNKATAKLFEDANTNPLAGCLVSILQLPILLGLYRGVTLLAKDGKLQEPFLWIPSLGGPVSAPEYRDMDWLTSGWVDGAPSLGWETTLAFLVMPIILVLTQSFTMSMLTPEIDEKMAPDEREQMERTQGIFKFLPLMIGFFSLQVPAGLTIYWFTSNLFTLGQSLGIKAYYKANPPNIELPDYWEDLDDLENMSPEDKRKAAAAGMSVGPKWEDILDEAKYHYLVERVPLREGSDAWKRAQENNTPIPEEMVSWVNGGSKVSTESNSSGELETVKA